MVVRKVSMILVGGVFGFHLKPDMQVHLALFLIALMIVAHLVARPFDELSKAHRVLQWLELGSLCVCWLTLHAGTVFFIGEKEGRISHESLTALSFYVVGGNLLFTLYLVAVYVRAALRESRTGGVAEQRRKVSEDRCEASPSPVSERGAGEKGSVAKGQEHAGSRVAQRSHGGERGRSGSARGQAKRRCEASEAEARGSDENESWIGECPCGCQDECQGGS